MKRHYLIYTLWAGMAILSLPSCVREDMLHGGEFSEEENVIPGLETTISLKVNIPDMDVATRADMAQGTDSELNSLWVGIFSAISGECTYANMYTTGLPQQEHEQEPDFKALNNIQTKSGPSYIVAVGNPKGNIGYQYIGSADPVKATPLDELLPGSATAANNPTNGPKFTWETYKNIAISRHSIGNVVDDPTGNLPMSGIYYQTRGNHPELTAAGWETANETPVVIPTLSGNATTFELPGAIHLRRLISQVTFNISAGDYPNIADPESNQFKKSGKRIVSVVPESYRVFNAPYTSWLHERKTLGQDNLPAGNANSGDVLRLVGLSYPEDLLKSNYRRSATFRGNQSISSHEEMVNGTNETVHSFDFWMLENKRWAVNDISSNYDAREKESKNSTSYDGVVNNSGIYTALCGETGEETMNNMAAYVEIRCKVEYTVDGIGALNGVVMRTADVKYTIHLGGVDPNGGKQYDWNDFAHRRNHKYTYNVTVIDVDRIIVEAHGEDESAETRPGIEGTVTDIMERYDLDSHYGVFNICLSNLERTGARYENDKLVTYAPDQFPFRLEVYYDDECIIIDQTNYNKFTENTEHRNTKNSAKLWQWIELRATNGKNTLARYLPYGSEPLRDDSNQNKTFRLNQIADIDTYPGYLKKTSPDDTTSQWYTVFVNEYVYEDGEDQNGTLNPFDETKNNWVNYVNQDPRICWLNVTSGVSSDQESVHLESKYIITQKSIQSFYDIPNIDAGNPDVNAIGLEYTDETYGFTLRWANSANNNDVWTGADYSENHDYSLINGKINQMRYLRNTNNVGSTSSIRWDRYITQESLQKIEGINESSLQYDRAGIIKGPYYVPAIITYDYRFSSNDNVKQGTLPNTQFAVTAMNACMNRNRDNNGNGMIDREEMRWYLPSSGEMVDLVNGRNSLEMPFMDYPSNPNLNSPDATSYETNKHHLNTRFHYISSNRRLLWAEEGITINTVSDNESAWNRMGWHVRCTRVLGTDLSEKEVDLTPAFTVDNNDNPTKIFPTYFESETLRDPQYFPLPPHSEKDKLNRISTTGFEFRKELINKAGKNYVFYDNNIGVNHLKTNHDSYINDGNKECATLDETTGRPGWRMPNIKEAEVIKLALNNAGINHALDPTINSNGRDYRIYTNPNGYQVGNFFASTYREYGIDKEQRAEFDPTGYYLGIVYEETDEGKMGRAQCLTTQYYQNGGHCEIAYFIRCVRDL